MLQKFATLITLLTPLFFFGCYTQLGSPPMAFERGLSRTDDGPREALKAEEKPKPDAQTEADAERERDDEENYYDPRAPDADAYDNGYDGYDPYGDPYYGGYYPPYPPYYGGYYSPYYYGGYSGYYGGGYGGVHHYDYLDRHDGRAGYGVSRRGVEGRYGSKRRVMNRSRLAGSPRTRIRNDAQGRDSSSPRYRNRSGQSSRVARGRSSRNIRSYGAAPSRRSQVRREERLRSSGYSKSPAHGAHSGRHSSGSSRSHTSHTSHRSHRGH